MNKLIKDLKDQAFNAVWDLDKTAVGPPTHFVPDGFEGKFAELIVEAVLDQVAERAYYTGDRDWSDELDRQWIQLEFGYGPLHDETTFRS